MFSLHHLKSPHTAWEASSKATLLSTTWFQHYVISAERILRRTSEESYARPKWLHVPHHVAFPGLREPTGNLLQKCSRWMKVGLTSSLQDDHHLGILEATHQGSVCTQETYCSQTQLGSDNKSSGLYQPLPTGTVEETEARRYQSTDLRSLSNMGAVLCFYLCKHN